MRVVVLTDDLIGPTMAGSGLRAWELAGALRAAGHLVCLTAADGSTAPSQGGPELVPRPPWRWAEVVVAPPWVLPPRAFLGRRRLVIDGVTPLLAELEATEQTAEVTRRRRTAAARLPLVRARADAVLVAGHAQEQWWKEQLGARQVPILQVPFGIPENDPPGERDEVPGIPPDWAIVLWWGGVWPWLDLDTLLEARAAIGGEGLAIVVPTGRRPGQSASSFTPADLSAAASRHGLRHPQVAALDSWLPYDSRHRLLNRSSLLAVLHRPSREADLSFRTRALDGVWAGVPLLVSEGGEVARLTRQRSWGAVVTPADPAATAVTLERMLERDQQLRCRRALAADRPQWRWSEVSRPLIDALPDLPAVRRRGIVAAALVSALNLCGARVARRQR